MQTWTVALNKPLISVRNQSQRGWRIFILICHPYFLFLSILLLVISSISVEASDWKAPVWADTLKRDTVPDSTTLIKAREIYQKNCSICHGTSGKGDGMMSVGMQPSPADFTQSDRMSKQTDGELFLKISNGKRPMPAWKNDLSEEQIWELIALLRTFSHPSSLSDSLSSPTQPDSTQR